MFYDVSLWQEQYTLGYRIDRSDRSDRSDRNEDILILPASTLRIRLTLWKISTLTFVTASFHVAYRAAGIKSKGFLYISIAGVQLYPPGHDSCNPN